MMERTIHRIMTLSVILVGELLLLFTFIFFLKTESTVNTILLVFGIGFCWYLYDRVEAFQGYFSSRFSKEKGFACTVGLLLLMSLPFFLKETPYLIHLCIMAGIYVMLATGLNFQLGSVNIVNLATAASYGVGAYTSALLTLHAGMSFWITLFAAGGASASMGYVLGLPATKTKDYYLTLVTIAFGLIVYLLLNNLSWTGGPNGIGDIPSVSIFGYSLRQNLTVFGMNLPYQTNYYFLILFFVLIYTWLSERFRHSRTGLSWNAIREDEIAAQCMGIDVSRYKILSFCINCFLSGVAGAVYAHYVCFISPENFQFMLSVVVVTMVILGGMDNTFGVIFGAVLLTLLPEKFRMFNEFRLLIYGVIVICALMFRPQGLFPQKLRRYQ